MTSWETVPAEPDQLGESPFWHPLERTLYWLDIPGRAARRWDGHRTDSWALPSEPGCIAPAASGGYVLALRDGIYRARYWAGPLTLVARFNHDPRTTRFNDGKADPLGRLWAGTIYEPRDARRAELYSIDCRPDNGNGGKPLVQLKAQNATTANGVAWSPDGATLYWADTPRHVIHAWDWNAHGNAMRHHRVFAQLPAKPAGWTPGAPGQPPYGGRPDGAAVDTEGNYYTAMYEGGRIVKFSAGGKVLAEITVPARCPTMPCFGGDDLRTLYVTTAREGRPAAELADCPLSGRVLFTRVDVPGLPVNFFRD